jgi:hypothetical protein
VRWIESFEFHRSFPNCRAAVSERTPAARSKEAKPESVTKQLATEVLALTARPIHIADCLCEMCRWWAVLTAPDARLRFDALKYLTDRRDGKAVQTVNHLHDKPIEMNVNFSLAAEIQKARQRVGKK